MPVKVRRSCINNLSSGLQHQLKTPSKESEDDLHSCKDEVINEEGCVISEKHVYKYRCSQCSLAFKTSEKLEAHLQYHMIRDASKCRLCERSFRTVPALLKHLESSHSPGEELSQYRLSLMSNPLLMAAADTLENISSDSRVDNGTSRDSADVNESITKEQMETIAKQAKRVDKILNYPLEKYLDPNRPFKCDVCKESFTQKNILLVHFNSVSHLHKLKKVMKEQQESSSPGSLLLTPQSDKGSPHSSTPGSTLLSVLGSLSAKKQLEPDDEVKPYKCNICQVNIS